MKNNGEGQHDKKDRKLAAFKGLAGKLKEMYPMLPVLIMADALYANPL